MKKMIALLLTLMMSLSLLVPVFAEETEPAAGGWAVNAEDPTLIPEEALEAFNKATEELVGCDYEPIALLGSQVVAGTNYCLLCETTLAVPDAQPGYALVYFYDGVNGEKEILKVEEIKFCAYYTLDGE